MVNCPTLDRGTYIYMYIYIYIYTYIWADVCSGLRNAKAQRHSVQVGIVLNKSTQTTSSHCCSTRRMSLFCFGPPSWWKCRSCHWRQYHEQLLQFRTGLKRRFQYWFPHKTLQRMPQVNTTSMLCSVKEAATAACAILRQASFSAMSGYGFSTCVASRFLSYLMSPLGIFWLPGFARPLFHLEATGPTWVAGSNVCKQFTCNCRCASSDVLQTH